MSHVHLCISPAWAGWFPSIPENKNPSNRDVPIGSLHLPGCTWPPFRGQPRGLPSAQRAGARCGQDRGEVGHRKSLRLPDASAPGTGVRGASRILVQQLVPFPHRFFFGWEGSPTKTDHSKKKGKGTLILTSQIWRTWAIFLPLSRLRVGSL